MVGRAASADAASFTPVDWPETKPGPWLLDQLAPGAIVGFDPWLHTADEIARLEKLEGAELNDAKKVLADNATTLCHGVEAAKEARAAAEAAFEQGTAAAGLPTIEVPASELAAGIAIIDLFCRAGFAGSNGEARRLIRGGGGRLNDAVISDETMSVSGADADAGGVIKLSAGKKRHVLVRAAG